MRLKPYKFYGAPAVHSVAGRRAPVDFNRRAEARALLLDNMEQSPQRSLDPVISILRDVADGLDPSLPCVALNLGEFWIEDAADGAPLNRLLVVWDGEDVHVGRPIEVRRSEDGFHLHLSADGEEEFVTVSLSALAVLLPMRGYSLGIGVQLGMQRRFGR